MFLPSIRTRIHPCAEGNGLVAGLRGIRPVYLHIKVERGAFAPLDSLVAWKMLPNKFLSSVSRRSFQPFRNFESRTINDTIRHLVEFVNAGRRLARRGGGCVDPQFSHVRKGCGDKQADSRSPESFAQSRSISSFTLVE